MDNAFLLGLIHYKFENLLNTLNLDLDSKFMFSLFLFMAGTGVYQDI